MKKYLYLILLFSLFISGCTKRNPIDFSSSKAFFSSLNEKEVLKKKIKNYFQEKIAYKIILKKQKTNC